MSQFAVVKSCVNHITKETIVFLYLIVKLIQLIDNEFTQALLLSVSTLTVDIGRFEIFN